MTILLVSSFLSALAFAGNPIVSCASTDGVKDVRIVKSPWGNKMQAKIYHNNTVHKILPCEMDFFNSYSGDFVKYYCPHELVGNNYISLYESLSHGLYKGTREIRDLNCWHVGDTRPMSPSNDDDELRDFWSRFNER